MNRAAGFFAAITLPLAFAASLPTIAVIESLTVDPPSPDCEDEITVSVEGYFPNTCFHIDAMEFVAGGNTFQFSIRAHEHVNGSCLTVIIPYVRHHRVEER